MKRYIEVTSTHRNRLNWPCPAEFVIPLSCSSKTDTALQAEDPIINGYPQVSWYQLPYVVPKWNTTYPEQKPRSINNTYYTSLWPISASWDQTINFNPSLNVNPKTGWITAMKFSGGTSKKPILNSVVTAPKNKWNPINGNNVLNSYYTPIDNYFSGTMIFKFTEDPSYYLNSWNTTQVITLNSINNINIGDEIIQSVNIRGNIIANKSSNTFIVTLQENMEPFVNGNVQHTPSGAALSISVNQTFDAFNYTGNVESSIIISYDSNTGEIELENPFSEETNITDSYFLIDFNTDPKNEWSAFVSGGPRLFIPNGSNFPQSYENMIVENYTLSNNDSNLDYNEKVIGYDFKRKLMYLENPINISDTYGSDTFILKHKKSLNSKKAEKISVCKGSILKLKVKEPGRGYSVGQTIGTVFNNYYSGPTTSYTYPQPDYILNTQSGTGFRGLITSVDKNGGIIDIKTEQQGCGYKRKKQVYLTSLSSGIGCVCMIENIYQSIEIARNNLSDKVYKNLKGNYVFLPNYDTIDSNGKFRQNKPLLPRYKKINNTLDIRVSDYPIKTCDNKEHVSNLYQVIDSFRKNITFGNWWNSNSSLQSSVNVLFLNNSINIKNTGITETNAPVYVPNMLLPKNGFIQGQELEYLSFDTNNFNHLNFTGTRIGRSQPRCHQIKLISLTLPNIPLDNQIGGLIAFYPYIYVELRSFNNYAKGVLNSNNPNANKALFRVSIRDTSTPLKSKFIKLRGCGAVQTVNFTPNDDLYFRVYLNNGELFDTIQKDTASPLPPDFFVQISAQFEFSTIR